MKIKMWTLSIGLTLATAGSLAGPPDRPADPGKAADARLAALTYPGARPCGGAGGSGGGGGKPGAFSYGKAVTVRTADSFEAVQAFYSKSLFPEDKLDERGFRVPGADPPGGGSGGGGGAGLGSGDAMRPLKMAVLNAHWHSGPRSESTTVVLTRGDLEKWTYIHIVLNQNVSPP